MKTTTEGKVRVSAYHVWFQYLNAPICLDVEAYSAQEVVNQIRELYGAEVTTITKVAKVVNNWK